MRRSLAAAAIATTAAWWCLTGGADRGATALPPAVTPAALAGAAVAPRTVAALAAKRPAVTAPPASEAPASRPPTAAADGFNVRGFLRSTRVRDAAGGPCEGLRVGGGEIRASRLRCSPESPRVAEVRFGPWIPLRDPAGAFGFALAPGRWRIEARHRPQDPAEPGLLETWCAVFRVGDVPLDFGVRYLTGAITRGVLLDEAGAPCPGTVVFSDKMPLPESSPLPAAGAELAIDTDGEGRFAFTFARLASYPAEADAPDADVLAFYGDGTLTARGAVVRPVNLGGFYVLRAPPPATRAVVLEIHAEPPVDVLCVGADGVVAAQANALHRAPDGALRLPLDLPPGVQKIELSRGDEASSCRVLVVEDGRFEIRPQWRPARVVEGGGAEGAPVRRLVRAGDVEYRVGRAFVRDGVWSWRGLPPDEELAFETEGRRLVVSATAPLRARVE